MRMSRSGINSLHFNQDYGCFSCATNAGLRIFNIHPLMQKKYIGFDVMGSVGQAEMLFRTNLVAMVGGGKTPKFSVNTVLIWDDAEKQFVFEITFSQPVLSMRLQKERLIIVLRNQVHVFSFPNDVQRLFTLNTRDNPKGLCEVSPHASTLVFPANKCGSIQIMDINTKEQGYTMSPVTLNAHQGELACLAIDQRGTMVATASRKGTLIRVFDAASKKQVIELRRGTDTATVYCITFSRDSEFLCASSDKGTVHIFAIRDTHLNRRCSLKKIGFLGQYVESQWGLASFTVPAECACICAFVDQSVVAACVDGSFHKYVFTKDGICNRESFDMFLDMGEQMD